MSEGINPGSSPRHGVKRWQSAFANSLKGLKYGLTHEAAIREEFLALLASFVLAPVVADSFVQGLLLVASVLFVLVVEILNTAIEKTLDRVSTDHHPLTGAAKDLGSLAVLLAIFLSAAIWLYAIVS